MHFRTIGLYWGKLITVLGLSNTAALVLPAEYPIMSTSKQHLVVILLSMVVLSPYIGFGYRYLDQALGGVLSHLLGRLVTTGEVPTTTYPLASFIALLLMTIKPS